MTPKPEHEDGDDDEIDEDQLADYCAMLDKLGNFPEKASINALSIAADDFSEVPSSASKIFDAIRTRLMNSSSGRLIPLVYVIDSLLKNVGGAYIDVILNDAHEWMGSVYSTLQKSGDTNGVGRLKKVWNTWREQGVIKDEAKWRKIGSCFTEVPASPAAAAAAHGSDASGFVRNPDGTLQLPTSLRRQMQSLLDEVQDTSEVDELEKVSLERLAEINPDLLKQIQVEAEMVLQEKQQASLGTASMANNVDNHQMESEWSKLKLNHLEKSNTIVSNLQKHVRLASTETTVPKSQADNTIHLYAAISASAQLLTDMLQEFQVSSQFGESPLVKRKRRYSLVKPQKFTTEGIKERNDAVIARLYDVGLPFVCSADGRRFGTQLELSKHLDALFRKSQLEKTMEKTEERGWYVNEATWLGVISPCDSEEKVDTDEKQVENEEEIINNDAATIIADETRSKCILCGIPFAMLFDQEDGEWKYKNCIEKDVLKDDDGPTLEEEDFEAVLVHRTCWEGLGKPEFLTPDQVLHATELEN